MFKIVRNETHFYISFINMQYCIFFQNIRHYLPIYKCINEFATCLSYMKSFMISKLKIMFQTLIS